MRGLWGLAAVAALLTLLCMTRLGVLATFGEQFTLDVTFGILRFRVVPSRKGKGTAGKAPPKKKTAERKTAEKLPKPNLEDVQSAWRMIWPPLQRALKRFGRGIRVDPMEFSVILAGSLDPAAAAEFYGKAQSAVWTIMPLAEELIDIRSPAIHIGLNFETEQMSLRGRIGVTVRIGTLLACGFGAGVPAAKWFMQYKKMHRGTTENKQRKQPPDIAA